MGRPHNDPLWESGEMNRANNLRKLREAKCLTQPELAEQFGSTQSAISNYESGTREPDISLLMKFADFFDVTIDYLVGRTDLPYRVDSGNIFYTNLEKEILLLCRELPTEDQEMMASVGRYLREKNREKKRPRPVDLNTRKQSRPPLYPAACHIFGPKPVPGRALPSL